MRSRRVRVAGIQMSCGEDAAKNLGKALEMARMAQKRGAELICFAELCCHHWFPRSPDDGAFSLAEQLDGKLIAAFRAVAIEGQTTLVIPFFERSDSGQYYNSAAVIGADGELQGCYRQNHVPQLELWEQRYYCAPGDTGFPVFRAGRLSFGILLSWDAFYPEAARILALRGATLLVVPTAAAFRSQHRWLTVLAAHAVTNNVFVLRVNRVGEEAEQTFYGGSFLVNPYGELVDEPVGTLDAVFVHEIDPGQVARVRQDFPFFRDRRGSLYKDILLDLEE